MSAMFSNKTFLQTPGLKQHVSGRAETIKALSLHDLCTSGAPDKYFSWGRKPLANFESQLCRLLAVEHYRCEDGFLAFNGHPSTGAKRKALIIDKLGIYYDATQPSELESLVINSRPCIETGRKIREMIVKHELTKYNLNFEPIKHRERIDREETKVLIIDQVKGDMSLKYGMADEDCFNQMISFGKRLNPEGKVFLKTHPDFTIKGKTGLSTLVNDNSIDIIDCKCNPIELLKMFDHVIVATSQMGFEALLCGINVHCFGAPFYSHWGLTDDRNMIDSVAARRSKSKVLRGDDGLHHLVSCVYDKYTSHVDEVSGLKVDALTHIENLVFKQ